MSHRVVITTKAERDADDMMNWIAQYAPEKAVLWSRLLRSEGLGAPLIPISISGSALGHTTPEARR